MAGHIIRLRENDPTTQLGARVRQENEEEAVEATAEYIPRLPGLKQVVVSWHTTRTIPSG